MVESNKQLARTRKRSPAAQGDDLEPILSRKSRVQAAKGSSARSRFIFFGCLFVGGLISSIACLWAMLYTSRSEEVAESLGLHRVANSMDNILSLLAYPALMFLVVLTAYAAQQLYRLYKEVTRLTSSRLRRPG